MAIADPEHSVEWSFTNADGVTMKRIASTDSMVSSNNSKYSIVSDRTARNFGELTVRNVVYEDRGTYSCTAANFNGDESAEANLTVHG